MLVILGTWETEIERIIDKWQSGQQVSEPPPQPIAGHWITCLSLLLWWEAEIRTIQFKASMGLDDPSQPIKYFLIYYQNHYNPNKELLFYQQ
jgi:hypothetical protein